MALAATFRFFSGAAAGPHTTVFLSSTMLSRRWERQWM
jgi:hypothetical protein